MMKNYLTIEEVSRRMHIRVGTARNRISRGDAMPKSIRVGRRRLFEEEAFQEWMDSFLCSYETYGMENKEFPQGRFE